MPVALPHAICGPQVPGTARPKDMTTLASLNPCLSGDCKAGTKEATPHKTTTQKMTTTELTKPTTKPPPTTAAHTTVKSTPSTADPVLPTDYWHLDKYSDTKCGDQLSDAKDSGYYRIQGYKNANDVCFTLAGGNLSTDDSGLDLWCQWWPGEGADGYRNCDQSPPLEKPGSWRFTAGPSGGHCASFTDAKCTHEEQSATMGRGGTGCVKNTKAPGFGLGNKVFKSIKCGLGNYAYEDYT
ncbi:hypothetical protein N7468_006465 [Penicillium chermesinum]|uniref:Secreted LysM effector LysM C-terminal domain-containing protein n=1 Tax=Penicillium chermesinum TaxID=63820 RepID=A0A9W9NSA6_9EURO|nr:uncharacterized protein N7468_006465 [Penicillium chermesinum]KAJ5225240.1 hypothetical protein N7468_006465 [Penicillium chermesinum]